MFNLFKNSVQYLNQEEIKELIEFLINIYNDKNNILVPLNNNKYKIINATNILYIEKPKKDHYIIALEEEDIQFKNNAFDITEYVMGVNSDFRCLNNGLWANLNRIKYYDSYYKRIYFSDKKFVFVTHAAINNVVKKHLGSSKDVYLNSESSKVEYYPIKSRINKTINFNT